MLHSKYAYRNLSMCGLITKTFLVCFIPRFYCCVIETNLKNIMFPFLQKETVEGRQLKHLGYFYGGMEKFCQVRGGV
jgi:hypothetical protein